MYRKFFKRAADIVLSFIGGAVILIFILLIALAIVLDSKGSPFFLQERLGKNGKVFKIFKFRTMVVGAEKIGTGIRTGSSDSRITRVGRFLRKFSLDELPQVYNVLIGDMSLIGPRPPVTYHPYNGISGYPEWSLPRFEMRPGMTGLSQVRVRNSATWDERMVYDVEYVKNVTFLGDIKILFGTVGCVFGRKNVYSDRTAPVAKTPDTSAPAMGEEAGTRAGNEEQAEKATKEQELNVQVQ